MRIRRARGNTGARGALPCRDAVGKMPADARRNGRAPPHVCPLFTIGPTLPAARHPLDDHNVSISPPAVVPHDQITPAWLTVALRAQHIDATVDSFTTEIVGTGQLAETIRFHLRYDGAAPADAPATLVGKFTSDNDVAATNGKQMG